jgi:hypothetical protein
MLDPEMGTKVSLPYVPDWTRDAVFNDVDVSLARFFERPIVARTYAWTPLQVSAFTAIFNPWTDFFGNPRVINRITNYNLLRAKLHVRFLINGNGFYYGRLMADYLPLANDSVSAAATLVPENAIQASQRLKVFIDPATCCASEMELPFVYFKDGVSIPSAEWTNLGSIYVRELQGLKHANAATQPLTVTVMVWATEVQMALPTSSDSSALVAQAGDEYASPGPVEATASAVASMAASVTQLPVIGRYARATEMAARATSRAASVFGWSRPAELAPHMDMHAKFVSDLAPSNAGDNVSKLTVDAKQEVTVDSNVIGINLPDELSVAGIAARESYLTPVPWTTARLAGDMLWTCRVSPMLNAVSGSTRYLPACAFSVVPFQWWRGKMRYRIQIVASAYHKGRLRIVWDPDYVQSVESNVQFTRLVDISEERDITIEVEWGQSQHFLPVASISSGSALWRATTQFGSANSSHNGVFSIYVLNDLATPNSTVNNDIAMNIYVSCNDLQVAAPVALPNYVNSYAATVQAGNDEVSTGNEPGCGSADADATMGATITSSEEMVVYFGERIVSFRQLLKRYSMHSSFLIANTSSTIPAVWTPVFTDVPFYYGFNNSALHTTSAAGKFSYVQATLMHWLMPAFAAMRGSMRSKYIVNASSNGAAGSMTVVRTNSVSPTIPAAPTLLSITSQSAYARLANAARKDCTPGAATTIVASQPNLEVEFPYYKPVRFDESRSVLQDGSIGTSSPFYNTHAVEVMLSPGTTPITLTRYVGVGEDFSLFWFQGCPPLQALTAPA